MPAPRTSRCSETRILTWFDIDLEPEPDTEILKRIETLKRINDQRAEEFWKGVGKK